jgi:hypothetical protein
VRGRWFKALRWVFVAVVVVLFARAAARNWRDLHDVDLHVRPLWLVSAAPFTFAGGWLLPVAWARLLRAYGAVLRTMDSVRIWSLSATSRYIPSGLAAVASRVVLASREDVPRALAAASTVVELVIIVGWGAVFAGTFLPTWPEWVRVAVAGGAAVGLVALPVVLHVGGRLLSRFPALDPSRLDERVLFESIGLYLANAIVKGIGFVLFASALLPGVRAGDAWLLIGAVNAAAILGMVGVTPAGLGVREAFITVFLRDRFGFADAAAIAAALRVWDLVFELTWLAIVGGRARRARRRAAMPLPG